MKHLKVRFAHNADTRSTTKGTMNKTPLMKRVEREIGREIKEELKNNIASGESISTAAVRLGVVPDTVRRWAKAYDMRFTNETPWKNW